jgi:DNA-binding response OmpR family regulator
MRADDRWRDIPCVILTAAGQEQQHTSAIQLGANDFMTKPFSPKRLYARAVELVGLPADESNVDSA